MKKILVATGKPFAPDAVTGIMNICKSAGYDLNVLEKYDGQDALIEAVKDANGLIGRSDKVTAEVINAAKNLEVVARAGAIASAIDIFGDACANEVIQTIKAWEAVEVPQTTSNWLVAENIDLISPCSELHTIL